MAKKKANAKATTKKKGKTVEELMKDIRIMREKVRLAQGMCQNMMGIKKHMHKDFVKNPDGTVDYGEAYKEFQPLLDQANEMEAALIKKHRSLKASLTRLKNKVV